MAEDDTRLTLQQKFGKAVARLRKERKISQEIFARDAGIDRRYMSGIENGHRNVSLDIIERIAFGLNLSCSELMVEMEKE